MANLVAVGHSSITHFAQEDTFSFLILIVNRCIYFAKYARLRLTNKIFQIIEALLIELHSSMCYLSNLFIGSTIKYIGGHVF